MPKVRWYCYMGFVANFTRFPAVQIFWKSVKIWQSYGEFKGGNFFETQCSSVTVFLLWANRWMNEWMNERAANPSVVCNVRAPYSGSWNFRQFSSPFRTLSILWPPCKILRRSSQGNLFVGGVKLKRGNKLERCHIRVSHLLMSFLLLLQFRQSWCW